MEKAGVIITIVGVVGTMGVGVGVLWGYLPSALFAPKIPRLATFLFVSLGIAGLITFVVVSSYNSRLIVALRNFILLCVAMWVALRLLGPLLSPFLSPPLAQTTATATQMRVVPPSVQAQSDIAKLQRQLQNTQAELHTTQTELIQARSVHPPTPVSIPVQITANQALDFIDSFRELQGMCAITITASSDSQSVRSALIALFDFPSRLVRGAGMADDSGFFNLNPQPATNRGEPEGSRFAGFQIVPALPMVTPTPRPQEINIDATPTAIPIPSPKPKVLKGPSPKTVLLRAPAHALNVDTLKYLLTSRLGLTVERGYEYPSDADVTHYPKLIYLEIGPGFPTWGPVVNEEN